MSKLVIFEIGEGNFDRGYPVKIRISEVGKASDTEISGRLPPASNVAQSYYEWQTIYRNLQANWLITVPETQITNVSTIEACNQAAQLFQTKFNEWLNQAPVRKLERQLLQKVNDWQNVRFFIKTHHSLLQRIPWHLWEIFSVTNTPPEIIVASEYEISQKQLTNPVKILAVFGCSHGINTQADLNLLGQLPGSLIEPPSLPHDKANIQQDFRKLENNLPGVIIKPLIEPSCSRLRDKLWDKSWDILFFAGHSNSFNDDSSGEIQINNNETLSLEGLRASLKNAVYKGLKLAIFNSCDGIGLARTLADVGIPYIIVMREPVPDVVAQHFLKYFLTAFTNGESLHKSVQQARIRLQEELETKYPCASWLPIIFQNPAAIELKYPQPFKFKKIAVFSTIAVLATFSCSLILSRITTEIKLRNRFSDGELILVNDVATIDKKQGTSAIWWRNYPEAVKKFQKSLEQARNDPETLIYLNNAKIANQPYVKIGVAVPIGKNPNVAQEILRGVAQAQSEINAQGGINGKLLKITIANDDNNGNIAKQIANKFVQDKSIIAVVGHNSSDASVPASYIYQSGRLVMISPTSGSAMLTDRTDRIDGNYIYKTVVGFSVSAKKMAEYIVGNNIKKTVICNDSLAKDQSFESELLSSIKRQHLQEVSNINCNFSDKNFQPEAIIQAAIKNQAGAIFISPQVDRIDKAIQLAKVNNKRLKLLGTSSLQTKKTLQAGEYFDGMVMASPWHPEVSSDKNFVQDANTLWHEPELITWRTATAFDATKVIATALKGKNITRTALQQSLSNNFSYQGVTGTIEFFSLGNLTGERVGGSVLVEVESDGNRRYRFGLKDSIITRMSLGEKILITNKPNQEKRLGVQAFEQNNYAQAIEYFQSSLRLVPNDPETHIYLQNALAARSGKTLTIAISVPISTNLNIAKEMLQGVAQAQSEINEKSGIQGYLLQVKIASDDNNPKIGEEIAKSLVSDPNILAVVGHNASDVSHAACKIYQTGQLVSISPTSFASQLSGCTPYFFRTAPNIRFIADSLLKQAMSQGGIRKLAICVDETSLDNTSFRNDFTNAIKVYGGNLINIPCDISAPDFNANQVIQAAIDNKVEGILLAPHVRTINKALEIAAANTAKKANLKLFGSPTLYTHQTLQAKADVEGVQIAVPWHPAANLNHNFISRAKTMWGDAITWRTATSYDATIAMITALNKQKTRQGLQQELRNPHFWAPSSTGSLKFLASGDRDFTNNAIIVKIQRDGNGSNEYKFSL